MSRLTQTQKALFLWRNPISYSKKWYYRQFFISSLFLLTTPIFTLLIIYSYYKIKFYWNQIKWIKICQIYSKGTFDNKYLNIFS